MTQNKKGDKMCRLADFKSQSNNCWKRSSQRLEFQGFYDLTSDCRSKLMNVFPVPPGSLKKQQCGSSAKEVAGAAAKFVLETSDINDIPTLSKEILLLAVEL